MEHSPKRSRLSGTSKGLEGKSQPGANGSVSIAGVAIEDDEDYKNLPLELELEAPGIEELQDYRPSFGQQLGSPEQLLAPPAPAITSSANFERDTYPQEIESVVNGVETGIASVFDVIIDSGTTAVAQVTLTALPTAPAVISVPDHGSLTVSPPSSTNIPSTQGGTASTSSNDPAQSSLSIAVPNSSSQIVLSSPPSTPLPSSSSMTLPSSSASSYSSSSTVVATISDGSLPVIPSTTASFSSFFLTSNFTTSIFTSTNSGTTLIGTTTLSLGSISSNTTRLTTSSTSRLTSIFSQPLTSSISTISTTSTSQGASQSSQNSQHATSTTSSSTTSSGLSSSSAASSSAMGTGGFVGGPGSPTGTGTQTSTASPSSTTAAGSGSNQSSAPPTPAVVGGVVGGLAGLTVLLVILLFILRWRRKLHTRQLTGEDTEMAETNRAPPEAPVTQRSSATPLAAAGIAPFLRRLRSHSGQTAATTETAPSERGFQNLGGRRIESVLTSGGDGYGGPGPVNPDRETNLAGSSFYRDSQGTTYGGPGSLPSSMYVGPGSPPLSPTIPSAAEAGPSIPSVPLEPHDRLPDQEVAVMRPSPARTPVTSQAAFTTNPPRATPPPRAPPSPRPPPIGDGIGRSHPSLDGSRSRFAENLG